MQRYVSHNKSIIRNTKKYRGRKRNSKYNIDTNNPKYSIKNISPREILLREMAEKQHES